MTEHQSIELCFDSTKSTLPAKIIHLRKISQQNHVKRMKLAYQRKEMNGLRDLSSCLSPSFPRKTCRSNLSFSTPSNFQSCTNDIQSRRKKSELLPAKIKSDVIPTKYLDSSKHNSNKKCAEVEKSKKVLAYNKNMHSSTFPKGIYSDFSNSNENKSASEDKNCTEFKNEIRIPFSKNELVYILHNNKEGDKNDDELLLKKSSITFKEQNNVGEKKNNKKLLAKNKPSRIPIWKPNLKRENNFTETKCHYILENVEEVFEKSPESKTKDTQHQIKELSFKQTAEKDDEDDDFQETHALPNLMYNCFEDDPYKNLYRTFCEEESRIEMSLVNKWMNGTQDTTGNEKNSSESSIISKFRNLVTISPSQEKKTSNNQRKVSTSEPVDIIKGSRVGGKHDYITDISESENNSDTCYENEETDDEGNSNKKEKMNEWNEENFEAESTITVPSDKDLELADHRDTAYRNLPDYPDTPYNLRYNRYKFKEFNKNLH